MCCLARSARACAISPTICTSRWCSWRSCCSSSRARRSRPWRGSRSIPHIGLGGFVDVAKNRPFHLPRRRNGLADTLGFYGVKPGPFLFIPLIGPTTLRDLIGGTVDRLLLPHLLTGPFNDSKFTIPSTFIRSLDRRVDFDEQLKKINASADPYAARRKLYLDRRQAEIDGLRGKHADPAKAPAPGQAVAQTVPRPAAFNTPPPRQVWNGGARKPRRSNQGVLILTVGTWIVSALLLT